MNKRIYLNLFIVSFVIMGLEMTAARFIAPSFGNTVYTWGIVISIFLIGSSIGYMAGGFIGDQSYSHNMMHFFYIFGIMTVALIPIIKDFIFPYLESFSSTAGTAIGVTILYFIPNIIFSSMGTILMKDGLDEKVSGKAIGSLHTASAIGSVLGTLVTTFFLVPLTHIHSVISVFAFMIFFAYLCYVEVKATSQILLVLAALLFVFLPFFSAKVKTSEILHKTTSLYHDIYVYQSTSFNGKEGNYRYLTFGNKTTIQGVIDLDRPARLVVDYAKSVWQISDSFAPKSEKVFMIGHGIGTLTRKFEQEGKQVKVVEIDKGVLEVSRDYFQYEGNSVEIGDGRKLLKETKDTFDVMVLDAYNNTHHIPFHLISKEFFSLTSDKLNDDGILIINAIGNPKKDAVIESMNTTLKNVYPYVYIFAKGEKKGLQNLTIVGSKEPLDDKKIMGQHVIKVDEGELILDADTKLRNLN